MYRSGHIYLRYIVYYDICIIQDSDSVSEHTRQTTDYKEFRKALGFFSKLEGWPICLKGCKQGDGNPECEIRNCCMERKLDLCFECSQFPCDKVKGNERMVKTASEYKKLGREKWLCLQVKKVQNGYELHTRKYYPHTLAKPE